MLYRSVFFDDDDGLLRRKVFYAGYIDLTFSIFLLQVDETNVGDSCFSSNFYTYIFHEFRRNKNSLAECKERKKKLD